MPFRLRNAPSVFQHIMNAAMADMAEYAAEYIDDTIIFSMNVEHHLKHLQTVFARIRDMGSR